MLRSKDDNLAGKVIFDLHSYNKAQGKIRDKFCGFFTLIPFGGYMYRTAPSVDRNKLYMNSHIRSSPTSPHPPVTNTQSHKVIIWGYF
jgi:hypothetical protein